MSSATFYREGGLALLLGALVFLIGNLLATLLFPGLPTQQSSALYASLSVLSFLGAALLGLGLPAIGVRQAAQAAWLGLVGLLLLFFGIFAFGSSNIFGFLIFPQLIVDAPHLAIQWSGAHGPASFFVFSVVIGVLLGLGGLILGLATVRARVLPAGAGWLLMAAGVLSLVQPLLPGTIAYILGTLSQVLLPLGLGWIGYALWTTKGEALRQPVLTP